ncbi:sugar transport protein MST6-like [Papaver somniferum]|uniref:sugar transport protein MST6-like n=1 Tax=Papaver somniferum TaxID=3469 RepID=UPI000E6FCA8A|nr:sugar transport protein MST6-like [Papaver somniferum]
MSIRHIYGTGTTPTRPPALELPSAMSKMRMNVEKPDQNKKMSLIFLMACFIGINSGFLIGYMTGIIGGLIFGTGFMTNLFPYGAFTYDNIVMYSMGISMVQWSALTTSQFMYILGPNIFAMGFGIMYQRQTLSFSLILNTELLDLFLMRGAKKENSRSGAQVYMSEMGFAHRSYLPAVNISFKMMIAIGIFVANLVNCGTNSIKGGWGWEVSIGIAALSAAIISIGYFLLPDTPMSMIKLGRFDDAKQLLQRLHGSNHDVYILFNDLLAANEALKSAKGSEKQIMSRQQNRPYRAMAIALPLFQQLTGINVIVIFAPYLFQVIGFQESAALTYTAIVGGVNVAATIIGIIAVSQGYRRIFLIAGGVQICVGQIMLGILVWIKLGGVTGPSDVYDYLVIATTCICVAGFAWSWGPLGWIFLSSDDMLLLYPLEFVIYAG